MTDPGLNHRLRQRSRRAGIMIGIFMLLTIGVCVGSFSVIYAGLDDFVGDFVSRGETADTPTPEPTRGVAQAGPTEEPPASTEAPEESEPEPTTEPTASAEQDSSDEFNPDYQLDSFGSVNLRSGPGVSFGVVTTITMEQPLEYLDESEPTSDPANDELGEGQLWLKFRSEDGSEGWIREIDVSDYIP